MANVLITGAKGQLGSELKVTSEHNFGLQYFFTDIDELDITDPLKTEKFIKKIRNYVRR